MVANRERLNRILLQKTEWQTVNLFPTHNCWMIWCYYNNTASVSILNQNVASVECGIHYPNK